MKKTPQNIEQYSLKELLELVDDTNAGNIAKKEVRFKIIKLVYEILGYNLSNDLLLALLAEPKAQLVLATAGGGKTTFSQLKIIIEKILRKVLDNQPLSGERVLCLVYNRHNVKQMTDKHEQLVRKLYASGIQGLNIDSTLRARTMHSFCNMWAQEYVGKTGLLGSTLLRESEVKTKLATVFKVLCKKHKIDCDERKVEDLLSLYNLLKETLKSYEECDSYELFLTLQLPKELVIDTYKAYDAMKERQSQHDFTDMLHKLLKLLREDEKVRTQIQDYYHYIVADEVQDLTPVMMEILRLVKGDKTPILCIGDEDQNIYGFRGASIENTLNFDNLFENAEIYTLATNRRCGENIVICIGDEDQNIYGFRGASIENTLNFDNLFENAEIYTLATNRRCGENIVNLSRQVVSWNTLRYEKDIEAVRPGGTIEYVPYKTSEGQLINLMRRLENYTAKELENTCICYRNKKSSLILSDKLENARLPFHILSGYKPFSHEIYRHMIDILDLLYMPYDREYLINLYKICPGITKSQLFEAIGYDYKKRSWSTDREHKHFAQYDYGKYNNHVNFQKTLQVLTLISNKINTMPMKEYIHDIFNLFDVAFWESKSFLNKNEEVDTLYREECEKFFSSPLTYEAFYQEYTKRVSVFERNDSTHTGLCLSTFHGLKGLEFDNVILIDLEDEIFPNFAKIDAVDCYSEQNKLALKEGETRLFFVAVTRAKDNLIMYYNQDCPSIYIDWLLSNNTEEPVKDAVVDKNNIDIRNIFSSVGTSSESNLISERMNMFDNIISKTKEVFESATSNETQEDTTSNVVQENVYKNDLTLENTDLILEDNDLTLEDNDLTLEDNDLTLEDEELVVQQPSNRLNYKPNKEANRVLDISEEKKEIQPKTNEDNDLTLEDEELVVQQPSNRLNYKPNKEANRVLDISEEKKEIQPKTNISFKGNSFMSSVLDRI